MAKKNYYVVVKGRTPGIYFSWEDCKAQIDHFSGAVYKGFVTLSEAEDFLKQMEGMGDFANKQEQTATVKTTGNLGKDIGDVVVSSNDENIPKVSTDTCLVAYVDGSYDDSQKRYAYGCVFVLPDKVVTLNGSDADETYLSMRNVAGEILGSEHAIDWAIENGYEKIVIFYDYEGIEKWANDIWKANKPGTIRYKDFVKAKRTKIEICFCKVAAHTGDTYNEMADKLAKEALGIDIA
ncbi:MAG: viroplasmin family protein [Lachnospiraceae bacterium]